MATTSTSASPGRATIRIDGYAPIGDYAVIGNKRTAALVARDGSIDWLCLPSLAGPAVFAALLDSERGGSFTLAPTAPFTASRCYIEDTNVLQTTFVTADGTVRVTDAMSRPLARGLLFNQVIRRIDGLAGSVPMRWNVAPRFDYGATAVAPRTLGGLPVFVHGHELVAVEAHGAGDPTADGQDVRGSFVARAGDVAVLALSAFHREPLRASTAERLLAALDGTVARWRHWVGSCDYEGPWRAAVRRSALALDLLVDDETGAIAAAATMGLPERLGGERNFDYRYAWLRDTNLTLEAMLRLGFGDQVHTSLAWMLRTIAQTQPRLRPMYRLDGGVRLPDEQLALAGYRGSQPVLLGNGAQEQLQLGNYGDLLDMTLRYVEHGGALAPQDAERLAEATDFLCRIWRLEDSSIWELHDTRHYTQGKLAAWLALDRAITLARRGELPDRSALTWRREAAALQRYLFEQCWSPRQRSYARAAGSDELDAGVLLAVRGSFLQDDRERLGATIDAIVRELGAGGPLVYRYSGMQDEEGAFLACSFWVVEALVRVGRVDEAVETMDALVALGSDVGLYSEEIDPGTGELLGNLPQALTHLALVNAAATIAEASTSPPGSTERKSS